MSEAIQYLNDLDDYYSPQLRPRLIFYFIPRKLFNNFKFHSKNISMIPVSQSPVKRVVSI